MNLKREPRAYWSFQTNSLKEDVRDILSSVACKNLKLQSPYQKTPWRFNLFRIEEFEKYPGRISEQYENLAHLRGWEGENEVSDLLSDSDMFISYHNAQNLLKEDLYLKTFIEESKKNNLNYIINSVHNGRLETCSFNGSVVASKLFRNISLDFFETQIARNSEDFKNQLFGYFENSEDALFKISDGYGKEIK
jgi:hypothetical protein